jgi:uncharacterized protein (DUF362 family)
VKQYHQSMDRRSFLQVVAVTPLLAAKPALPSYRVTSPFKPDQRPGIPGRYPGEVVRVTCDRSIDVETERIDAQVVRSMLSAGMKGLTGASTDRDAWSHFIAPDDVVGIKVNCSGAPQVMSSPEVVSGIVANLVDLGVPASSIYIYERFQDQLDEVHYERSVPAGVQIQAAEHARGSIRGYDPSTFVEVNFFGEDDTRSYVMKLVSQKLTKIINVPNMKEHQAAGVTGCLKNAAYGNFSNVARSHRNEISNTYSFIGSLAAVEPVRSRTVLNIMDGLRGVWHAGPFSKNKRFRFYPKQIMFGTDPVAMDRLLIEIIEEKRKEEHAPSIFDRSPTHVRTFGKTDPNFNAFVREPGHVEYASQLGLGVYDIDKIKLKAIVL